MLNKDINKMYEMFASGENNFNLYNNCNNAIIHPNYVIYGDNNTAGLDWIKKCQTGSKF